MNSKYSNPLPNPVYIVAAKRTPVTSYLGKFSKLSATDLGGIAIKAALESIKLDPKEVEEVIMGNVVSAGLGQAPARQAAIKAGLPINVTCTTINKVCASGMKSIIFAAQSITLGQTMLLLLVALRACRMDPFT